MYGVWERLWSLQVEERKQHSFNVMSSMMSDRCTIDAM